MEITNYDIIIVGAGLSGIVMAERFASVLKKRVLVIDKRNHIGGNCYDYVDEETGILMNRYGAHLFHTNDKEVYQYITRFCKWKRWEHEVLGLVDNQYCCIPANITTVNRLCDEQISNSDEMDEWLSKNQIQYSSIDNSEKMAKSRVGNVLYEKLFKHYTFKQWNRYPEELLPEVLARIPVRNNHDTRYFSDKYQALPEKGYTHFFNKIIEKNPLITVILNTDYFELKEKASPEQIIIYTGPIDHYFSQSGYPALEYRSISFEITKKFNTPYYQPNSVVNYPGSDIPYTRCVEYKHFLNQQSEHTVIVKETTTDTGEPYYPVLNEKNTNLYQKYLMMANKEKSNVHFIGRLASYKYFNMDQAIRNALDYFKNNFKSINNI